MKMALIVVCLLVQAQTRVQELVVMTSGTFTAAHLELAPEFARSTMCARTCGSRSFSIRSGTGQLSTSPQPGISHNPQKLRSDMFIGTSTGIVSAMTRPPSSRARRDASS